MNFDVEIKCKPSKVGAALFAILFCFAFPASANAGLDSKRGREISHAVDVIEYLNLSNDTSPTKINGSRIVTGSFYHKCLCGLQQVRKNGICAPLNTSVIVAQLQNIKPDADILTDFVFSQEKIKDVSCSEGFVEIKIKDFYILNDGSLYSESLDYVSEVGNYCFEFEEEGKRIEAVSKLCIPKPGIPFCHGEKMDENLPLLNITFGDEVKQINTMKLIYVNKPSCKEEYHRREIAIQPEEPLQIHFQTGTLNVMWSPPFPARVPVIYSSDTYCITYSKQDLRYNLNVCYEDPVKKHERECKDSVCVRKCCPITQIFDMRVRKCLPYHGRHDTNITKFHDMETFLKTESPQNILIENGFPWCQPHEFFMMDPKSNPMDNFYLLSNGSLHIASSNLSMPPSLYCTDWFMDSEEALTQKAISCFLKPEQEESKCLQVHKILYPILIAISCIFLSITLIVYLLISELRTKLHGKSLLSHVMSLLIAFLCQLIVSWKSSRLSMVGCQIIALANQVSFLWAFFWLNVMCFDIWWTLKSMRIVPETGENSRRRFALYSLYAWGCPIIICCVTSIFVFLPSSVDTSGLILPGFGVRGCWFQDVKSTWVYFHGFTLLLYVTNIFFFFHVASILINGQLSTEGILRTTKKQHRERVYLYLKLFAVMGITWVCEVASWQEGTCEYWIFTDIVNSLQGVLIFFIFMCNKKVFQKIQAKGLPLIRRVRALVRTPSNESGASTTSPRTSQTSEEASSRRLSNSVPQQDQLIRKF